MVRGNLERYRRVLLKDITADRRAWIEKQMRQRMNACRVVRASIERYRLELFTDITDDRQACTVLEMR